MLKTTESTGSVAELEKTKAGVGGDNVVDDSEITNQISFIKRKN